MRAPRRNATVPAGGRETEFIGEKRKAGMDSIMPSHQCQRKTFLFVNCKAPAWIASSHCLFHVNKPARGIA